MILLVADASEELLKELNSLALGEAVLNAFAPEGLDIEVLSISEAVAFLGESAAAGRFVDMALVDGPSCYESAAKLAAASPKTKIAVLLPASGASPAGRSQAFLPIKRPLLPGELDAILHNLMELCGARIDFDGLFGSSSSLIAIVSPAGLVSSWNPAAAAATGVSPAKALGRSVWELFPFLKGREASLSRTIDNFSQERINRLFVETPGSEAKYYDVQFSPMPSGRGAAVKVDDVSNDVKKDEHLRQAQKMDSVGSLASGLAHDFNNVIGGIEATMSSIKFSLDSTEGVDALKSSLEGDFELVDESVKRGKGIIEQLMSLSRRKELPLSPADLNRMLSNIVGICRNTFPKTVSVSFDPWPEGEAKVMAFPTQIEQSFLNLCINASHAMTIMRKEGEREGGSLSVSITKIGVGENISSVMPEALEGEYWLVSVSDTGVGMTREIMQRIFEPFFTTKDKGKGTGLGLAMVYNIIRQHKGFMDIFSEPGSGSTFLVFLPVLR